MPPKRKQPATSAATAPPAKLPAKRRSKLAKEHDITAEEETEILEAFALFAVQHGESGDTREGVVAINDVRRCLIALNAPPKDQAETDELLEVADPEASGWVTYEHFVAIAALKMHSRDDDPEAMSAEVEQAYHLFTKGEEREITLNDLRRIAKEIREDIPENVLKDMILEATGGEMSGVGMEEFEGVMRRAGVFS